MRIGKNIVRLRGTNVHICVLRTDEEAIGKYTEWMNDEEHLGFIDRNYLGNTLREEKEWAESQSGASSFNIITTDGRLIGNCSVRTERTNAVIGIMIGEKESRGLGYGTEVMQMLIRFAFEELGVHRVSLMVNSDNQVAIRCYTKCGFVECGREHEAIFYHGKWADRIHMEILKKK